MHIQNTKQASYSKIIGEIFEKTNQNNPQPKISSLTIESYQHKNNDARVDLLTIDNISSTMVLSAQWPRELIDQKDKRQIFAFRALEQSDGRGQRQNKWHSPKGNLYLTILLKLKPQDFPFISMMVANSLKNVLNTHLNEQKKIKLKWINDLILQNKKIGGVLIKNSLIGQKLYTQIGIGINTSVRPNNVFLDNLEADCLQNFTKQKINLDELTKQIINEIVDFVQTNDGLASKAELISKTYENNLYFLNEEVQIWNFTYDKILAHGKFIGVNQYGHAKIQGVKEPFIQGRMKKAKMIMNEKMTIL